LGKKPDFFLFWDWAIGLHLIFSDKFTAVSYLSVPIIPDFITIAVHHS
jgi:hypothetical protein